MGGIVVSFDVDLARQFILAHAETILTWLVAGLVMLLLAKFELRRTVRKSVKAMSESVAMTVAACVPDIAHAARAGAPPAAHTLAGDGATGAVEAGMVEAQRAEALRRLALETVATVMSRARWLDDLGNLRVSDDTLAGKRLGGADPLLVVAPQPVVQAYLAAQRSFDDEAAQLQQHRRGALRLQEQALALDAEAGHLEQETAAIVMRFEQANHHAGAAAGAEGADYQRFLIQKYNALGQREKEIAGDRADMHAQARAASDDLCALAAQASLRYSQTLTPLMEQLRAAWGHGDAPGVFDTWLRIDQPHSRSQLHSPLQPQSTRTSGPLA